MSFLRFLIASANAPFTIVGGIAVCFAILQLTGVMSLFAGGDHEADHDVDADHDVPGDADTEQPGFGDLVFGPLGLGRLPFSIIWQTYAVVFAVTGLMINLRYLGDPSGPPLLALAWSLPAALLAGYAAVALLARFLGPLFATKEQEATSRAELVGHIGVVISSRVTAEFGEIRIRDKSGHDLRVVCRLAEGSAPPTEKQRVVVVDYEASKGELLVAPIEDEDAEAKASQAR